MWGLCGGSMQRGSPDVPPCPPRCADAQTPHADSDLLRVGQSWAVHHCWPAPLQSPLFSLSLSLSVSLYIYISVNSVLCICLTSLPHPTAQTSLSFSPALL